MRRAFLSFVPLALLVLMPSLCAGFAAMPAGTPAAPRSANADGVWFSEDARPERMGHTSIIDPVRGRLIVFAGYNGLGDRNDVWALSLQTHDWSLLQTAGTPPPGGYESSSYQSFYVPLRDEMLVVSTDSPQIWALTLGATPTWRSITPANASPGWMNYGVAYDTRSDRLYLFGGVYSVHGFAFNSNELWALDLGSGLWGLRDRGNGPAARQAPIMAAAPETHDLFVQGGVGFSDTWLWHDSTSTWVEITPPVTPYEGIFADAMVHDARTGRMLVLDDNQGKVWELDPGSPWVWRSVLSAASPTPPGTGTALAADSLDDRLLFVNREGTWAMPLATPAWTNIVPTNWARPPYPGQTYFLANADTKRDRLLALPANDSEYLGTWELTLTDSVKWGRITPPGGGPYPVTASSYDPVRDRLLALGPYWISSLSMADPQTWAYSDVSGAPILSSQTAAYDLRGNRIVVVGVQQTLQQFGDLQVWTNAVTGSRPPWHLESVALPRPDLRFWSIAGGAYDPDEDRFLCLVNIRFFDGTTVSDSMQVWALSLADSMTWSIVVPNGPVPGQVMDPAVVLDRVRRRLVLLGGAQAGRSIGATAWAVSLDGPPVWTPLAPAGVDPLPRTKSVAIYDPLNDRIALWGGHRVSDGVLMTDTSLLTFGQPPTLQVGSAADSAWAPGDSVRVDILVESSTDVPQSAVVTLSSGREWPGFPLVKPLALPPRFPAIAHFMFLPPDTARGAIELSALVAWKGAESVHATCSRRIEASTAVVSLVSAQASVELVRLTWQTNAANGELFTLQRQVAGVWSAVDVFRSGPDGRVIAEDRQLQPGAAYDYRLLDSQGHASYTEHVQVPTVLRFALLGLRPNPSPGPLSIGFELPSSAAADLAVFDVSGRKVWSREVGSLGPGVHIAGPDPGVLAPGLYLVRLHQGTQTLGTRAIVLH